MNESIENQLRRALRPVEAPQGFADRVLAALPERGATVTPLHVAPPAARTKRGFLMPAALAASLLCAVLLGQHMATLRDAEAQRRTAAMEEQRGRAASRELMQALHITGQKLDIAYEAMNVPRAESAPENRS